MLHITGYHNDRNYRVLHHGCEVFHKALECVLLGEKHFHVKNPEGCDYDLIYEDNQSFAESSPDFPDSPIFHNDPLYPPYLQYDEKAKDSLCFDIFSGIDSVHFQSISEYAVVLTGVILSFTNLKVICDDERIRWFFQDDDRLIIPDKKNKKGNIKEIQAKETGGQDEKGNTIDVVDTFYFSGMLEDYGTMDCVGLFHHVFLFQWLTKLPFKQIKYAELLATSNEGIGSILIICNRSKVFFEKFGIEVTLHSNSARYSDNILKKYFNVKLTPEDSNEDNTIYITNYYAFLFTKMLRMDTGNDFSISSLKPEFVEEMREYGNDVLGDKRMLGLLMRGSDYIISMSGVSSPVTVESAIPKIKEWMKEDGYDGIFIATEDKDILNQMLKTFPGQLFAVSQERYSITDFVKEGVYTIDEIDRKRHPIKEEYEAFLEDNTVNYFYALYLLSRCESFMYSGQCGGIVMTKAMNNNSFKRMWCFAENREIF